MRSYRTSWRRSTWTRVSTRMSCGRSSATPRRPTTSPNTTCSSSETKGSCSLGQTLGTTSPCSAPTSRCSTLTYSREAFTRGSSLKWTPSAPSRARSLPQTRTQTRCPGLGEKWPPSMSTSPCSRRSSAICTSLLNTCKCPRSHQSPPAASSTPDSTSLPQRGSSGTAYTTSARSSKAPSMSSPSSRRWQPPHRTRDGSG
mmetsp:Transcript_13845/g.40544  ORF Transcript_13845/g.40544 Transcript_13845/m.40544 type:complete len:200 (+) Transcript_13845:1222-1821(+)